MRECFENPCLSTLENLEERDKFLLHMTKNFFSFIIHMQPKLNQEYINLNRSLISNEIEAIIIFQHPRLDGFTAEFYQHLKRN
jgi:hypothetical protein